MATFTLPEMPDKACIFRFQRNGRGPRKLGVATPYSCAPVIPVVATAKSATTIKLELTSPGAPCDEMSQLIPGPLVLTAKGNTVYRSNGFGIFYGTFSMSAGAVTLFKGRLELLHRVTRQQADLVPAGSACDLGCRPRDHLEGWLVGEGSAPATADMSVRAVVGAHGKLPSTVGTAVELDLSDVVIAGTVTRKA